VSDLFLGEREEEQMTNLSKEEMALIVSALVNDRVGKWGDGRQEKINALINKIKKEN